MAPSSAFIWEYWTSSPPDIVELTCLLPNSCYIPLQARSDDTLLQVKADLWERAAKYPLYGMLHPMSEYLFQFINSLAAMEEVEDESKRLRDLKPVCGVLWLVLIQVDKAKDKTLNTQISHLIGKDLKEFDDLQNSEVNDFRMHMRVLGEKHALKRAEASWLERLCHRYPPRLASNPKVPPKLESRQKSGNSNEFFLVTHFENSENTFTFSVLYETTPLQLLNDILKKKAKSLNETCAAPDKYVLRVCGQEEYLVGPYPLIQFLYIQETLAHSGVPIVITMSIDNVPIEQVNYSVSERRKPKSTHSLREKTVESSWNINEDFSCTIVDISKLNVDPTRNVEVVIQAGIYHGGRSLCESQKTTEVVVSEGEAKWNKELKFPIRVDNIPRMARLCFVIYTRKSRKVKELNKDINPLAWVNTNIFDYKNQLKTEAVTLYMWTYVEDMHSDNLLHPLGTVVSNPEQCNALTIRFSNYEKTCPIMFPPEEDVKGFSIDNESENGAVASPNATSDIERLKLIAEKDPIYEMHEQDRNAIWALRDYFLNSAPTLLPRLLQCVEWDKREHVATVAHLLDNWSNLAPEIALELLDYAYPDTGVRRFAVCCLKSISDEDLSLYLLQLVQALKHESYLMCDLAEFLLTRALNNMKIGHFLFWHLRSEMHEASISVRFRLVLEAYCRGCQEHLADLLRQSNVLERLKETSRTVRALSKNNTKKATTFLVEYLAHDHCTDTLSKFSSPLDPSFRCKQIRPEKCRVMDSKMRPLRLEFENVDAEAYSSSVDPYCIILKDGDDLRQDMFTLQMLRIMDRLWKDEGYDFRMNTYSCISMEDRVGMIEVVLNADTIANIQKEKVMFVPRGPFVKGALLSWLSEHNNSDEALNKAIDEFTLSCAGYCVATYVLGVADRHSDNIMVKKSGQLFHIDFGHILGHFKEKFGVKRERVPFVLTRDFICVINKGQNHNKKEETREFQKFRQYCEAAFQILRKHGHLFLSLFSMMISTGLPELSSEKDLQYLRETLVLDLSDEAAAKHFESKFQDAMDNAWKTSVNWALHNMDKNNKL